MYMYTAYTIVSCLKLTCIMYYHAFHLNPVQSDSDMHDNVCDKCEEVGDLLKCDFCPKVFHLKCLEPPLKEVPEDEHWICHICRRNLRAQQVPSFPKIGSERL